VTAAESANSNLDPRATKGIGNFQPVFIVGCPRSGTTLLAAIIDRHSQISIPPETRFFEGVLPRFRTRNGQTHDEIVKAIQSYQRIRDLAISDEELLTRLQHYSPTVQNGFRSLLETYAEKQGKSLMGEKSPVHLLHVPTILDWYPEAVVLCLIRDGRDVVQSLMRVPWTHNNLCRHAAEWSYRAALAETYHVRYSGRFQVVRFEHLIEQPENEVKRICRFLNVAFEPQLLDSSVRSSVVPAWEQEWKGEAARPIDIGRVAVWKKSALPTQLHRMNTIMQTQLRRWGYNQFGPVNGLSTIRHMLIGLHCVPFRRPLYRLIRPILSLCHAMRLKLRGQVTVGVSE